MGRESKRIGMVLGEWTPLYPHFDGSDYNGPDFTRESILIPAQGVQLFISRTP